MGRSGRLGRGGVRGGLPSFYGVGVGEGRGVIERAIVGTKLISLSAAEKRPVRRYQFRFRAPTRPRVTPLTDTLTDKEKAGILLIRFNYELSLISVERLS